MRQFPLASTLAHHVLEAAATCCAVIALAAIALVLELFKHQLVRWGASAVLVAAVGWLSHAIALFDMAFVGLEVLKGAARAVRRLFLQP